MCTEDDLKLEEELRSKLQMQKPNTTTYAASKQNNDRGKSLLDRELMKRRKNNQLRYKSSLGSDDISSYILQPQKIG